MRLFVSILLVAFFAGCSPNNVDIDNSLEKFFTENKVQGTFALFNNATGRFTIYNLDRYKDSAYTPASTFKIVNTLIGLQTGAISSEKMVIKWDSVVRPIEAWNKDLTMAEAFKVSAVPYYQEVARRIGKSTMQYWLDTLSYGTRKITSDIDTFWLDHSLKIRPDEQLGLVKSLYFRQLPFHEPNQEKVKEIMLVENKLEYKLAYKTGWSTTQEPNFKHIGWVVGWVEENQHPYFFVLNIESDQKDFDMQTVRLKILKDILGELGFLQGKK